MKRNILILLLLCIVLFSCSDKDDPIKEVEKPAVETKDPFITLKKSNIDFSNEGGSEAILIESNVIWTAKSSASWCTVTPSSGNKSTTSITLSAPANESYDNRSCTVTIESGNITKTITVNQGENLGLLVTQDRYELSNEESTIKVEVKANIEFEVKINDEWITKIETRGLTTSEMEFKIAKNDAFANRDGSITIKQKGGNITSTITIFQSQEDVLILSEKDFDLSSETQSVEVEIKTNIDYEIIIPEDAKDWVTHVTTRALRTETVVLNIIENDTEKMRYTKVQLKDKATDLQETITINQMGNVLGVYWVDKMGTLGDLLSQTQKDTITSMTVKGEINKADFDVMKSQMPKLRYIDLRNVRCEDDKVPDEAFGDYKNKNNSNTNITTIHLPNNITTIGRGAFAGCYSLNGTLILPNELIEIGEFAFYGCIDLSGILNIPERVKTIKKSAFHFCLKLTGLNLPNELTTIEDSVFQECTGLSGSLILPDNLTTIGNFTFKNCTNLKGPLTFPDGLISIGDGAFWECSNLTGSLILPYGLVTIGEWAFRLCTGLTGNLTFPDGLESIGKGAFWECSNLTGSLSIPDKVTSIEQVTFNNCSGFTGSLSLPKELTIIESYAFSGCEGLTGSLILPDKLISIEGGAFFNCKSFTGSLIIPDKITRIGESAFNKCSGFTQLILGNSVNSIGNSAFKECSSINEKVIFPISLNSIDVTAFWQCDNLEAFRFPHTTPPFELNYPVFDSNVVIEVPKSALVQYKTAYGWNYLNIIGY